jgi:hypothetical protein
MRDERIIGWAFAGALALAASGGCGKHEEPIGKNTPTPPSTGAKTGTTSSAATAATAATAAPTAAPTFTVAPGRSPTPTLDDWNSQKKEVTVKGSSALNCETKMVREYLRVSCRGKNDTGGTPTGIKLVRGAREALTFSGAGVESLIVPVVEGMNFEAVFSWTDKSHPLTIKWPKGSKMPVVVGVFEGAKSPLDRSPHALDERLCDCHKKVFKQATCEDMLGGANEDCDRTWGNDCGMLLACSRGEPGAMAKCRPGWVNGPPTGWCVQLCGPGKPACPAGNTCVTDVWKDPICLLD